MKKFDKGVSYYTFANVRIGFPEDDICCGHCPMLSKELGLDREYCRRTGEYIVSANYTIGYNCPLVFEVENDE